MKNIILSNVLFGADVEFGLGNIIGIKRKRLCVQYEKDMAEEARVELMPVEIGDRTVIMNHVLIYEGVSIGPDAYIDDYARVGSGTHIGSGTMLLYGAKVYDNVHIGDNCRIAGFIPNDVIIGHNVTMMGSIAHKYDRPLDWTRTEPSPVIEDDVVIGIGSTIVGGITVSYGSYIAAGTTLTKDVPPHSMVLNTNEIMPISEFEVRKIRQVCHV